MRTFRLTVQVDVEIDIDPESHPDLTDEAVRRLVWQSMFARMKQRPPTKIPGARCRIATRSFTSRPAYTAEVAEIPAEPETAPSPLPRWKLVRISVGDDPDYEAPRFSRPKP